MIHVSLIQLYNSAVYWVFLNLSILRFIRSEKCYIFMEPSIKSSSWLHKLVMDIFKKIKMQFFSPTFSSTIYNLSMKKNRQHAHKQYCIAKYVIAPSWRKFTEVALTWDSRDLRLIQVFKQLAYRLWENSSTSLGLYKRQILHHCIKSFKND